MANYLERTKKNMRSFGKKFWNVGKEDPRRVIHALKVGISLALVSQLYLIEPISSEISEKANWAVMTVVVVLEFTAGSTLSKGFSRALGTFFAGLLAFLMQFIANRSTELFHEIFTTSIIFIIGVATTYSRFFPYIRKNYDSVMVVFLMTFNLIAVQGYKMHDIITLARQRFYTISIGVAICLIMSLFVFPNWSGQELHDRTITKIEGLAGSLEAVVSQYFNDTTSEDGENEDALLNEPIQLAVLDSTSVDETLASYASWEPKCSRKCWKFPWQHYVKVGKSVRHFGYTIVALQGCLHTEIKTPKEVRALFKEPCVNLSNEVSKALRELANGIRNKRISSPKLLLDHIQKALKELECVLKSQPRLFLQPTTTNAPMPDNVSGIDTSSLLELKSTEAPSERRMLRTLSRIAITSLEFAEALPFAAFTSLLLETVARLDLVIEEVEELGRADNYEECKPGDEVVVNCENTKTLPNTGLDNYLTNVEGLD